MAMNQAEREQYEQMMGENVNQEAYKRRSSILKFKDETTKLLPNTGMKRRVSFHNLRKVQEFDKEKCDLHTDHQQEEPMHLTNNSDGLKADTNFSVSFVAGANQLQDMTMADGTMTFLQSIPQAISTPMRKNCNSHNTTTALFQNIAAATAASSNVCPALPTTTQPTFTPLLPIKSGRGGVDDFTSLFFANIQAPGRTEQEPVVEMGEELTCAVFANIAAKTEAGGTMNVTSSVFANLDMNTAPAISKEGIIEPMDVTSELFEVVQKNSCRPSPVLKKSSPVVKKLSPVVSTFSSSQSVQRLSPLATKSAAALKKSSPLLVLSKPDIKKLSPVAVVAPSKKESPVATMSKPEVKAILNPFSSSMTKSPTARILLKVTPARKAKTPTTPLQVVSKKQRQTVGRVEVVEPEPPSSLPHKGPSPMGKSPSFNFTTTINSPASFMEGQNAVDSLPFKYLTTIEEKSAPNFTFETINDSVQPLEEEDRKIEEEKEAVEEEKPEEEEEHQSEVKQLEEDEKMDMSENSRWSMAFHGDSPSGVCTISVQAAEKRKQLLELMSSIRRDRSRSSSVLSQSFKSPSPQAVWPSGNESQIQLLEDIGCPSQADLLQLSENTKTYPFKENPAIIEQDTYIIEEKENISNCILANNKHQPTVPSPLVMSEETYVLHKEQSYGFNSAANKTPEHKVFGDSMLLSPWTGAKVTPAHKNTFCDNTMNTKPLATGFQEPTYIEDVLDDALEEAKQKFFQDVDMIRKVSERKRALYALMRELLQRRVNMQKAEKNLETEMRTSFQALLTKKRQN